MKILIVGGTGLIGGDAALYLKSQGHDVTLMARKPTEIEALKGFDLLQGDYINDDFSGDKLKGFDALFFSAAADIRNIPMDGSISPEDFYAKANDAAVPAFFAAAKAAGIKKCVYIGTFYPQIAPEQIGQCAYVTSRHNTCEAVMGMNDETFHVSALNPPFVLGDIDGMEIPHINAIAEYALGKLPDLPPFAPLGGTNHISSTSLAQAALNIFEKDTAPKAYLVGDENLSWQQYLQLWFDAAGADVQVPVIEQEHPMFPHIIQFAGPDRVVSYETDADDLAVLDYSREQIKALVEKIVAKNSGEEK